MYPIQQYVGEKEITELTLHVYYTTGTHTSTLYEDAGEGYGYETGDCSVKKFTVTGTADSLTLEQSIMGSFNPTYKTYRVVLHGLPFIATSGDTDGTAFSTANLSPDEDLPTITVTVSADLQKLILK